MERKRKENKKLHEGWELSFDWKDCRSNKFVWQKIDYMHNNPCTGKWQLAVNPIEYIHGSARFYLTGVQGIYAVTNFMEMEDIDSIKANTKRISATSPAGLTLIEHVAGNEDCYHFYTTLKRTMRPIHS